MQKWLAYKANNDGNHGNPSVQNSLPAKGMLVTLALRLPVNLRHAQTCTEHVQRPPGRLHSWTMARASLLNVSRSSGKSCPEFLGDTFKVVFPLIICIVFTILVWKKVKFCGLKEKGKCYSLEITQDDRRRDSRTLFEYRHNKSIKSCLTI